MLAEFNRNLYRRNPLLAALGWVHFALFAGTMLLWLVDDRQVMGYNTWIKPAKFMFSLAVYLWTIAWFSAYIRNPGWLLRFVSWTIFAVIVVETGCILLQAGRATMSHFNFSSPFDGAVFATMGLMIAIDMLMTVVIFLMFTRPSVTLRPAYLWGIRLGILVFLIGGWIGGQMISHGGHTIGGPDGGPGIPVLGWSTVAGDLRIAHGLGLHALQFVPFAGFLLSESTVLRSDAARLTALFVVAALYLGAVLLLYQRAMGGAPLFAALTG